MKNPLQYALLFSLVFLLACNDKKDQTSTTKPSSNENKKHIVVSSIHATTLAQIDGLKGKVKSVKKITSHASSSKKGIKKVAEGNSYLTTYDKNGNGLERAYFNSASKLQTKTIFQLDAKGRCNKALMYQANKSLLKTIQYEYNEASNLVVEKHVAPNGTIISKQLFTYNALGQLLEEVKYKGNSIFDMKTMYAYNTKGNVVSTKFYRPANNLLIDCNTIYEKYDTQGNWIQCTERTSKGSLFLVERSIVYHTK